MTRNGEHEMSDQPTTDAPATDTPDTTTTDAAPKPTETVEFWKQKAREQEKRAKDNASAAQRLAEIEESNKSESERTAERITQAERRAVEAEARVARRELAIEHGLSKEDAALLDGVTDEDAMRALAVRLAGATKTPGSTGNVVPREGTPTTASEDPNRKVVRDLFAP